jgi:hypothetical protein
MLWIVNSTVNPAKRAQILQNQKNIVRLGNFNKRAIGLQTINIPLGVSAVFIDNKNHISGKILNLRYFIGKKGKPEAPFRVHIYKLDSLTNFPGKDLLDETKSIYSANKSGWFCIDVYSFQLQMPLGGFFVGLEWLPYYYSEVKNDKMAVSLGFCRNNGTNNTWYRGNGQHWYQLEQSEYNAMITVDIKIE